MREEFSFHSTTERYDYLLPRSLLQLRDEDPGQKERSVRRNGCVKELFILDLPSSTQQLGQKTKEKEKKETRKKENDKLRKE